MNKNQFFPYLLSVLTMVNLSNSELLLPKLAQAQKANTLVSLQFPSEIKNQISLGDTCQKDSQGIPMMVLMPVIKNESAKSKNYGKTINPNPLILVYLPAEGKQVKIQVNNNTDRKEVESRVINVFGKAGILEINLLAYSELKQGQTYNFALDLVCNSGKNLNFSAEIKRENLAKDLEKLLAEEEDTLAKVQIYAQNDLWFETLALMAEIRQEYQQEWEELLKSVGLQAYQNEVFILDDSN
jgi:hypothetical protein